MNALRHSYFRLRPSLYSRATVPRSHFSTRRGTSATSTTNLPTDLETTSTRNLASDDSLFSETPLIFDTHKMVNYLKASGFSQIQSEAVTEAMARVSQHANRHNVAQMVTKSEFVSLRSELSILEKADFALLKTDINTIEKRMDTSVAEIYTALERVENRVIKWVIAVAGAIGLAIIRLTTTSGNGTGPRLGAPPPPSNVKDQPLTYFRKKGFQVLDT